MSLYETFQASKIAPAVPPTSGGGGVPPATPPVTGGGLYAKFQAQKFGVESGAPLTAPSQEEKGGVFSSIQKGYSWYADQVERKAMSFNAGLYESVGQLARSFQWLGDRLVGDRIVQASSDKILQSELKAHDDMLKIYRDRKARGDEAGAKKILDQLQVMSKNQIPYEAYANTTDSVFYKAQDKTKEWADTLRKSAGITPENQTFTEKVFEGAGSSATYFVPGIGVAKGASILARVSPRIALLFGGSASASLEAMAEAGQTYDEVLKTKGVNEAGEASTKVFFANAILLTITNQLGVFSPAKMSMLKKALLSAPVEGLQEASQQMIQNQQTGKPIGEGVVEAGLIGSIVGSVMGGTTDLVMSKAGAVIPPVKAGLYGAFSEAREKVKTTTSEAVMSNARTIADAIKQVESSGNYEAKGASGENGAYQFMPATWKGWAKQWLGDANAPMTKANQDMVAEKQIQSWLDQGYTAKEIALLWNGGSTKEKKGVNSKGVAYDSGAYARKVLAQLGTTSTVAPTEKTSAELQADIEASGGSTETPSSQGQIEPIPVKTGFQGLSADVRLPETTTAQSEPKVKAFEQLEKIASRSKNLDAFKTSLNKAEIEALDDVIQFHGSQNAELPDALKNGTVRVSEDGVAGKGFYVTNTPETAEYFGKQVREGNARVENGVMPEVYAIDMRDLNIKKLPYGKQDFYDFLDEKNLSVDEYTEQLQAEGYDGLNLEDRGETVIFDAKNVRAIDMNAFVKPPKTQKELVEEAVASKPKTIKEIATELGIKEPNVRRILGQGALSGTF